MPGWTLGDMPDQTGRVAIVTGANSGIGAEAAVALAAKGAHVVLAVRSLERGQAVQERIARRLPAATAVVEQVDMADLTSIRAFAGRMAEHLPQVDVLLNNAGLGMQPERAVTADGFERQFGTNHLGHFALTGLLIPALLRAPAPRVVAIASLAHRTGRIDFADLQGERRYNGSKAYSQSKLANLMFAFELDRRARAQRSRLISLAAHPGVASTGFMANTGMGPVRTGVLNGVVGVLGQDAARGALPGLYAATMPGVTGGQYWGPDGFAEVRGAPRLAKVAARARDEQAWQRLWAESERLTGVAYPPLA